MHHKNRWTIARIRKRLEQLLPLVYKRKQELPAFRFRELDGPESAPDLCGDTDGWAEVPIRSYWGRWRIDFMLRNEVDVPEWADALVLELGESGDFAHPEALLYLDERPVAACDRHHHEILLPQGLPAGRHRLALHGWSGLGGNLKADLNRKLYLGSCLFVAVDQELRDLHALGRCALGIAELLPDSDPTRHKLLNALEAAFQGQPDLRVLQRGIAESGTPLDVDLWATGHAHIDVAWLWTYAQTRRKAGRTFHTVLHLMEQFPDFHFTQSQPALYEWVREDYPELFARIQQRVAEGRWEPTGGMWVEADGNLTGAEALVRQLLLGRQFYREHFGDKATPVLWLPDVFGYPASLPQLIKQAELEYFFTIKIGWSQYNRLPFDSFWWQGLDGTRVLTSFSTTPANSGDGAVSTYNALAEPRQVVGSWTNALQKEHQRDLLMTFGHGDGGGGPNREMLENLKCMAEFPGAPRVRQGSALEFFQELEKNSGERLPVWNGELYLELHRGTYTSQARTKRFNRKLEVALHAAEFLCVLTGQAHADLRPAWKTLCLNQFHDVLPGSSIGEVYADSDQLYTEALELVERQTQAALRRIPGQLLLVNPTSFHRREVAFYPGPLQAPAGLVAQPADNGTWVACDIAPYTVIALDPQPGEPVPVETLLEGATDRLENPFLRVELNADGEIVRIWDKLREREVLAGTGNVFQAFDDRPVNWDAWDIDVFYEDTQWSAQPATRVRLLESGPLVATVEVEKRILDSIVRQRIRLTYNSPRLDFETTIDWRERQKLLKVAFPVNVHATTATYEIQWGAVERPTHRNTSWDWARFEVCAHKWADLSEADYGVSLLNDCKYGYDIRDNVMRLTLLRSPISPDPQADQGEHRFTYSLLPHAGRWGAFTTRHAYALNHPLRLHVGEVPAQNRYLHLVSTEQQDWAVIETVKPAENGNGIIVRLFSSQARRGAVRLQTAFAVCQAFRTNLLEEDQAEVDLAKLYLKPFEILTLRLLPEGV
jgi:alpha-mannosidase